MSLSARLSPRERDIVRLRRRGLPYKAIAFELGIAESTARVLGSRARRKLGSRRLRLPEV